MNDKITATDKVEAATSYNTQPNDSMDIAGHYSAICYSQDGFVKWTEEFFNIVVTVGKNATLDGILGNTAQGAVYMGLKGTGTAVAADTMTSHASWSEITAISVRGTPSFSAASAGSKATSSAVSFTMTGTATVAGCFIVVGGTSAVSNTTGILFSAGDFSSPKSVVSGDTIAVTYTATLTG